MCHIAINFGRRVVARTSVPLICRNQFGPPPCRCQDCQRWSPTTFAQGKMDRMSAPQPRTLRAGMIGMGMIFEETYRPFFETVHAHGMSDRRFGDIDVLLIAVASRTGRRAEAYRQQAGERIHQFDSFAGDGAIERLLHERPDFVCVATPDDRHFEAARQAIDAGAHVLIEKPAVLDLRELDELVSLARAKGVLTKVVYHKLLDPDHKKLRTLVVDGLLQHVNNGYCSLLEPKQISGSQFSEWIQGATPAPTSPSTTSS